MGAPGAVRKRAAVTLDEPATEPVRGAGRRGQARRGGHRAPRRGGFLRGLSGVLAGGLVALFVALVVAWGVALREGSPGPGAAVLAVHAVGAVVAVAIQRCADRTPGARGVLAALATIVVVAAVLVYEWLI
ncbi:MAG: hypothetical protein QOI16_3605 [Pseudonocardiales bacterium]|nr:hypothetical protein [Pseudonocardiales bacterium]